jgi:hypothetical protein
MAAAAVAQPSGKSQVLRDVGRPSRAVSTEVQTRPPSRRMCGHPGGDVISDLTFQVVPPFCVPALLDFFLFEVRSPFWASNRSSSDAVASSTIS